MVQALVQRLVLEWGLVLLVLLVLLLVLLVLLLVLNRRVERRLHPF
eukprot:COSAG06_NODE_47258_length_340_cov_1.037344_1_plen_46_part_00